MTGPSFTSDVEWKPPAESVRHELFGILATTEPVPNRGVRLARAALEQMVEDFTPRPLRMEHGIERQGTLLRLWLEDRGDGITELHFESEIFLPVGVDPTQAVPPGMSISVTETAQHTGTTPIVVAADSMTFDDDALDDLQRMLLAAPIEIVVERQHQFAVSPPPLILLIIQQAAVPLLQGVAASATWELMKAAVSRLLSRSKQPDRQCRLHVTVPGAADIDLLLPLDAADSVEAINTVFQGVADIVRAGATGAPEATSE